MKAKREELRPSQQGHADWMQWGPYVSEREWGTVREDYSADGRAWDYFPHDHARSRAYRWNEDGLAGISDDKGRMCFALALWNGKDPILKERLFGVSRSEGNHGEDVKEYYYYLDNTPTHSYMKYLYKYPQAEYPYALLVEKNRRRVPIRSEYELIDTGIFDEDRYFDVFVEYAKASPQDILVRISAVNRGPEEATLDLLPTLWFRNTWSWSNAGERSILRQRNSKTPVGLETSPTYLLIEAQHWFLGDYIFYCEAADDLLFTNNDTNMQRLFGVPNATPYVKDAFHDYLIYGNHQAINPARMGTKTAARYTRTIAAGATCTLRLRLTKVTTHNDSLTTPASPFADFDAIFALRQQEADEYYASIQPAHLDEDQRRVQRQALAGMLWNKQFYHYIVDLWLKGDPAQDPLPPQRKYGRNAHWQHLYNERVMSVPDKWEYPWYTSWGLAFHCITFALIDSTFAKSQLDLLLREWYMHPNGQLPAYEWALGDVTPPVHAWAAYRIYKIDQEQSGRADRMFLETIFHKLLLNFTWWISREDYKGQNVFQGGSLGMDNIGVFDRNASLPTGGYIEQSDGTSWMGMYCLNMMTIALELALTNSSYEGIATKFFEHFLAIAAAMNNVAGEGNGFWDEEDEFFYDVLHLPDDSYLPLKIRSLIGLIPLCAVETLEPEMLDALPRFKNRLIWFLTYRPDLTGLVSHWQHPEAGERRLLALVRGHRLKCLLKRMLNESEFLSPFGLRSLSRYHLEHPYLLVADGVRHLVDYRPGETSSGKFGGNTNWRGPVWFPINYLLIEALQKFYYFYGDDFKVECPTGSGQYLTLKEVAEELSSRLTSIFLQDEYGRRAVHGRIEKFQRDPYWRDLLPFYEYFHGDTGAGMGASHHTGWAGLVASLLQAGHSLRVPTLMHQGGEEHSVTDAEPSEIGLRGTDLSGTDLREIDLHGSDLSSADLSESDLRKADLRRANLHESGLVKTMLSEANLSESDLGQAHLREANLHRANLHRANLNYANLSGADLSGADLSGANLRGANLSGADLSRANLSDADLRETNCSCLDLRNLYLSGTIFTGINLSQVDLSGADLRGIDFSGANLRGANLSRTILSGAVLHRAVLSSTGLSRADLSEADLSGADLRGADLRRANLSEANLNEADLTGCFIYAISAWDVRLEGTIQLGLIITDFGKPTITVDNLEVAQFIYLLLNNKKIRDVINTITSKVVLILGRFTPERKVILEALRDELRILDYLPVLFDFERPSSRDFTETVSTLAHLARFILADITDPSSIPQELQVIVPNLKVPVLPLLQEEKKEYSMFMDFIKYPWVLPVYIYTDQAMLLRSLREHIIAPAEQKIQEYEK